MFLSSLNAEAAQDELSFESSPQFKEGKFSNPVPIRDLVSGNYWSLLKRYMFEKRESPAPISDIPLHKLDFAQLTALPNDRISVIRLGHSSIMLKVNGDFWLLDPVFSERASPFSFAGPKRFHQLPIDLTELPDIKGVIISHNHYDHMDEKTLKLLSQKVEHFLVPLGNFAQLTKWGIDEFKIQELDWWQSTKIDGVTLTATPAQHFSGRGLSDRDKTLWNSWVIKSQGQSVFFSGDTGYFDGFKTIGEMYGPFDITLMETGAYDAYWPDVHMTPEQTMQAHLDVRGKKLLPIHNGTFDLAFHDWDDPMESIVALADKFWVDLLTPIMGQPITLQDEASLEEARDLYWWREAK
ncbi:MBL fold metallo-hydrolase [Pleionea sp. CnH1-48]|uniref:MBL fold metallo-hydrolase n=1 Tax=Pleionea sp. CnH1-48 TaxID=2954494 RepID=UPI0020972ECC|nr:MBL fold metallo-hydrolase [Pleionea sp. CnH1-48]MCO7225638.1 MBL fold metallo-hydrolase [Pleionea sp. CnH1-48]